MGCLDCGKTLSSRNVTGRCRGCFGRVTLSARRKHPDKQCASCGIDICRYGKTSLCRACFRVERLHSPEVQAKRTEGVRRHAEKNRDRMRLTLKLNHRRALSQPSYIEYLKQRMKLLQPLAVAASLTPEARKMRGLAISRTKQQKKPQEPKRPLTFEEKLQAVAEGRLRVVDKVQIPSRQYDFTLGGVSDL